MQGNYRVAVRARNLIKRYGELTAVNSINFDILEGECFGFLGPNGAGKTSTMKMMSCVSPVNGGELVVHGMDVRRDQRKIKYELGIVSQSDSLDPDLSVLQNLLTYCRYFNMPRKLAQERAWESLRQFQLEEKAHHPIDELSGGMRRRLLIARAMLHDPRILVLDEPTTGLDPQARLLVWDKLAMLKSRGITILLTTHYMDEAAHLCDRLVVIDQGNVLVEGAPALSFMNMSATRLWSCGSTRSTWRAWYKALRARAWSSSTVVIRCTSTETTARGCETMPA